MTDAIPQWAMEEVEKTLLKYWASQKELVPTPARIWFARALVAAVAREREECAKVAELEDKSIMSSTLLDIQARSIATAIRRRGE
jgi:hypothetical protein